MATVLAPTRPDEVTHPSAFDGWDAWVRDTLRDIFRPAPRLTLPEWADAYRMLARGAAHEAGPWRTSRVPYLREIMEAVSDPDIEEMVIMKPAQIGFTEGVLNNAIGYFIDQDPSPILVVQPSDGDAEEFSKKKLAPMIDATPRVRARIADGARTSSDTMTVKTFPGGFLALTGATSPKGLRRDSIRVLLMDEVDGYPSSAGAEGDPVGLARKRTNTFPNRKIILGSTPTVKGRSRIETAYLESDQREREVPCPHCGAFQVLRWGGKDEAFGLKWENDDPETAAYLCEHCATLIEEHDKARMDAAGRWVQRNPGARVAGWKLNALISPFDGARWSRIVEEFMQGHKDPDRLKLWVNTVLGETWEDRGERSDPAALENRREAYAAEVPAPVAVLTAGVDVQGDRLELAVKGWGAGEESWLIRHERIYGDTEQDDVWQRLEGWLTRPFMHEGGTELRIRATFIDSGFNTSRVYAFVRGKEVRGVYAAKGIDGRATEVLRRPQRRNKYGVKPWAIGTWPFKDIVFRRLNWTLRSKTPGPGYMHFPPQSETGTDAEYFAQFAAEEAVNEKVGGRIVRKYRQIRARNEAIDLEVLATAALHSLGARVRERLGQRAEQLAASKPAAPEPQPGQEKSAEPPPPKPEAAEARAAVRRALRGSQLRGGGGGFVGKW